MQTTPTYSNADIVLFLFLLQSLPCQANFGIASLNNLLTDPALENSVLRGQTLSSSDASKGGGGGGGGTDPLLCRRLGLRTGWQKRICQRSVDMADVLLEAVRLAVHECQTQFRDERWNCSSAHFYRKNILRNDFKETSFLYAVSSAGLVHAVSRACSRGQLDLCTCEDRSFHQQANRNAWMWGGCGDNLLFGRKFAHRMLLKDSLSAATANRLSTKTMKHNLVVGIKTVQKGFRSVCKCHGVSASCTTKTCWQQLAEFHGTGSVLKRRHDHAVMVTENRASEKKHRHHNHLITKQTTTTTTATTAPKHHQLVYAQESPDFCVPSKYSPGTRDRRCGLESNCGTLCCGRGYNVERVPVRQRCNCVFVWCCQVRCEVCVNQTEVLTCK